MNEGFHRPIILKFPADAGQERLNLTCVTSCSTAKVVLGHVYSISGTTSCFGLEPMAARVKSQVAFSKTC